MKKPIRALSLIALLSGLATATHGQNIVVWHDDFDLQSIGANSTDSTYGRIAYNFGGSVGANPIVVITNKTNPDTLPGDPSYTHTNYCAFIFDSTVLPSGSAYNFGWDINSIAATGNTNAQLRAYTLAFDIAVQGDGMGNLGGFVGPLVYVYGHTAAGSYSSGQYYGNGAQIGTNTGIFPAAGSGWIHYEFPMADWATANHDLLYCTNAAFSFGIGDYMAGLTVVGQEEIDIADVQLLMNTNLPPLPGPPIALVPAKPGLRVFGQNSQQTYNQEGFSTADVNQSWIGVATPANPVSYSVTIGDFDTVNNYTLYVQFAQNATPGDPFGVYNAANALVWNITAQSAGFTTAVNWKTNLPANGQPSNALPTMVTTSLNGRGTWKLTFTNNTDGTVTAPDGTSGAFTLPNDPAWQAALANPVVIDFGTAPNNTAGFGQWITFSQIAISNVLDGTEFDDFTKDDVLNTALWNPGFSVDSASANNAGSVFQISTNTPYWANWGLPDDGFGLETKASLKGGTNMWFSPSYYGTGVGATNTFPTKMGKLLKWTLIPSACLPTVDGTVGGPASGSAFFRLANPPPSL
jgi:hypothetical protein